MSTKAAKTKADTNGDGPPLDLKAALLEPEDLDAATVDIEIEGIGTVTVRPLSREESYLVASKKGAKAVEAQIIACALVNPRLTFDEATSLMKRRAGIVQTIVDVVQDISGMGEGARKEAIADFLGQPE